MPLVRTGVICYVYRNLRCLRQQIGQTAGQIWHLLNEEGPLSFAKLVKQLDQNRDVVMQAVGWLAREEKVNIQETNRGGVASLAQP
ncbi:MAG: hypothetical protein CMJ81_00775 [Planctomycetaceae bacterium]|nr:hypothetical protein [Planctomycetaceae bacterium]